MEIDNPLAGPSRKITVDADSNEAEVSDPKTRSEIADKECRKELKGFEAPSTAALCQNGSGKHDRTLN